MFRRPDLLPSIGLAIGAGLWGLTWIPVRAIEQAGIGAAWTGPVIFASGTILFLPVAIGRWRRFCKADAGLVTGALLAGLAFATYIVSLNLTDVVRVLLLFYMSPLWSTVLGVVVLKERLNINRVLALLLAFSGLVIVLGAGVQFPWPREIGDWFALASGISWSFASLRLSQSGGAMIFEKIFLFFLFALGTSVVMALLPFGIETGDATTTIFLKAWPWIAMVSVLMIPVTYLTIWPASVLSPGRVGMLLMAEIVVGVASAAILTDEPFGAREITGTILILSAAIVEVMRRQNITPRTAVS